MNNINIYVGGHARQNNGDAGIGICYYFDSGSQPFYEEAEHVGIETQNSAVYHAVIKALKKVREWNFKNVTIYSDNRLVVAQLANNMSTRAQNIVPLYENVQEMAAKLDSYSIKYVTSKNNQRPRELAKAAALTTPDTITAQAIRFDVGPGITGLVLAFTPKLMVIQFKYRKGSKIGPHKHFHEQASYITRGALKYVVADKDIVMLKGAALVVSGGAMHQIDALEDTIEIVTYYPMRTDLLGLS